MRAVTIATPLDVDFHVTHVSGSEGLGRPFSYMVDVYTSSEPQDVKWSDLLGQGVSVAFHLDEEDETIRYIHGHVASIRGGGRGHNHAGYQLLLRPFIWLLSQASNCRIFQQVTVPDVIKKVFKDHGFTDFNTEGLSSSYRTCEYLTQYRESDLHFVTRLMEQEGIYFYFRHEEKRHELVLADGIGAHELIAGAEEVPYRAPGQQGHGLAVHTWSYARNLVTGTVTLRDFDFERPYTDIKTDHSIQHDYAFGDLELYDYPGGYQEEGDGKHYARVMMEAIHAQEHLVSGQGDVALFQAGGLFKLIDYGDHEEQNQEYLITRTQIQLTGTEGSHRFTVSFNALPSSVPYRLPRLSQKHIVAGPQTATVVGNPGQEICTDNYGRVKLQFHWDREGKSDENSSCYVRVSQQWAGSGFGSLHTPRIGQEVLVSFLEGDPDRPIVTGRVYNEKNLPPFLPDSHTQSGIRSRSTKDGLKDNCNEIRFEDKKGEEHLYVQAERDLQTVVKRDETRQVGKDQRITVTDNQTTTVGKDQTIKVTDNQTTTIGKDQSITITGNQTIHADKDITIDSGTQITLKVGETTITITSDTITLATAGGSRMQIDPKILAEANGGANLELGATALMASKSSRVFLDTNAELSSSSKTTVEAGTEAAVTGKTSTLSATGGGSVITNATGISNEGTTILLDAKGNLIATSPLMNFN